MDIKDETVKIYTLNKEDEILLPLLLQAFEKENISLQIRSRHDSANNGIFIDQKGLADLFVFTKDEKRALILLNEILDSANPEFER